MYQYLFGDDGTKIKIRENRRDNQLHTTQRHRQHWVNKTHDEDKQNKYTTLQHRKDEQHESPKKTGVSPGAREL